MDVVAKSPAVNERFDDGVETPVQLWLTVHESKLFDVDSTGLVYTAQSTDLFSTNHPCLYGFICNRSRRLVSFADEDRMRTG